jgi:hypothetical protein
VQLDGATGDIWAGVNSSQKKLWWDSANSKLVLEGAITVLAGSTGIVNLEDATHKTVTTDEKTGAGRGYIGLDSVGDVCRILQGAKLTSGSPVAGLNMTNTYMGYYTGTAWTAYIKSDGKFAFKGTGNNYVEWDGTNLNVRGKLNADDMQTGTLLTSLITIKSGSSPSPRIEITGTLIAGYSDATTKQFYLQASDGKAYAGAGAVILDATGLKIKGQTVLFYDTNNDLLGYMYGAHIVGGRDYIIISTISVGADPTDIYLNPTGDVCANADIRLTGVDKKIKTSFGNIALAPYVAVDVQGLLELDKQSTTLNSAGEITATKSYISIDTYGGAATDDLVKINGGSEGQIIVIKAENAARTVVVKNGTYLTLAGGVDFSMDSYWDCMQLMCVSPPNWIEISRADNGA